MAAPLVQWASGQWLNVSEATLILPAPVAAGNLLILDIASSGGIASFDWILGGSSTPSVASNVSSDNDALSTVYVSNSTAGMHTIDVVASSPGNLSLVFTEYTGIEPSPFDKHAYTLGTSADADSGGTATATTAYFLAHNVVTQFSGTNVSITPLGGNDISVVSLPDGTIGQPIATSYSVVEEMIQVAAAFTFSSSVYWMAGVTTWKMTPGWVAPPQEDFPPSRAGGA